MKNQVTVTANKEGQVFSSKGVISADGKEYGFIRVEEVLETGLSALAFSAKGYVSTAKPNSALISISKNVFDAAKIQLGQTMEGKIRIIESTTKNPFRANQEPKRAGKDGGVLLFNGLPIYRETEFTSDLSAQDVLIAYTSVAPVAVAETVKLNS